MLWLNVLPITERNIIIYSHYNILYYIKNKGLTFDCRRALDCSGVSSARALAERSAYYRKKQYYALAERSHYNNIYRARTFEIKLQLSSLISTVCAP